MGAKTKEIGGGAATGLSNDYISSLQSLLNGGGTGAAGRPDAMGSTGNIMNVLRDILSAGGGKAGNALDQLFSKQSERDINGIRARFGAGGGAAFGTPAAFAEGLYRSESAPRFATALNDLQMKALLPLLQQIGGLSEKGISQRQVVQTPGVAGQILGPLAGIAKSVLPFVTGGFGAGIPAAPGMGNIGDSLQGLPSFDLSSVGTAPLKSLEGYFG